MPEEIRSRDNWNALSNVFSMRGPFGYDIVYDDHTESYPGSYDETLMYGQVPNLHQMEDRVHTKNRATNRYPVDLCDNTSAEFPILPRLEDFTIYGRDPVTSALVHWHASPPVYVPLGRSSISHVLLQGGVIGSDMSVPDTVLSNLNLEAFNYFAEVFPQELSTSEFVQGFTQLRELLPEIKDSIVSTLAGGYLTKTFGWDNLTSDLGTLSQLLSDCSSRMDDLKKTYGVPTRLGFVRRNVHDLPFGYDHYTAYEPVMFGDLCGSRMVLTSFHVDYRATAWVTQLLDFIDGIMGWFRAIATSLGLDNPVKLFWQVLPFSFVVDWFLNVSGHLDALTRARPAVGWDINSITHSLKYELTWDLETVVQKDTLYERVIQSVPLSVNKFYRRVDLPFDLGLLDLSQLSKPQQLLLLALGLV